MVTGSFVTLLDLEDVLAGSLGSLEFFWRTFGGMFGWDSEGCLEGGLGEGGLERFSVMGVEGGLERGLKRGFGVIRVWRGYGGSL